MELVATTFTDDIADTLQPHCDEGFPPHMDTGSSRRWLYVASVGTRLGTDFLSFGMVVMDPGGCCREHDVVGSPIANSWILTVGRG